MSYEKQRDIVAEIRELVKNPSQFVMIQRREEDACKITYDTERNAIIARELHSHYFSDWIEDEFDIERSEIISQNEDPSSYHVDIAYYLKNVDV